MQFHQVTVLQVAGQVFLNGLAAAVNEPQLLLVHRGRTIEQLVDEPHLFAGGKALDPAGGEVADNRCVHRADRDDQLLRQDDAQRDGGVDALAGVRHLDGNVHDDEGVAILQADTGRLFRVGSGHQVGRLYI